MTSPQGSVFVRLSVRVDVCPPGGAEEVNEPGPVASECSGGVPPPEHAASISRLTDTHIEVGRIISQE